MREKKSANPVSSPSLDEFIAFADSYHGSFSVWKSCPGSLWQVVRVAELMGAKELIDADESFDLPRNRRGWQDAIGNAVKWGYAAGAGDVLPTEPFPSRVEDYAEIEEVLRAAQRWPQVDVALMGARMGHYVFESDDYSIRLSSRLDLAVEAWEHEHDPYLNPVLPSLDPIKEEVDALREWAEGLEQFSSPDLSPELVEASLRVSRFMRSFSHSFLETCLCLDCRSTKPTRSGTQSTQSLTWPAFLSEPHWTSRPPCFSPLGPISLPPGVSMDRSHRLLLSRSSNSWFIERIRIRIPPSRPFSKSKIGLSGARPSFLLATSKGTS